MQMIEKANMNHGIIFRNHQSPGDVLMLTAALRDLHRCYPNQFQTDVRSTCPELWANSPYITPLDESDPSVRTVQCHYPLIHQSNQLPYHFIHGFIDYLNEQLGLQIRPTAFRGDIHLSEEEMQWFSPVEEMVGEDIPFWIIVGGGKRDFTIKWWSHERYQQVVDHFRGRIQFVQVGEKGHFHPALSGVIDLRGRTDLRQLIRLMYHARGVVCPVTFPMHLAAAVPMKGSGAYDRPCVVIAGGREPTHWEAYSHHQFLHTVGALPCCASGGCWRSRTVPLGDGDEKDRPEHLCADVVEGPLPRCMHMISVEDVVRRVELYMERERLDGIRAKQVDINGKPRRDESQFDMPLTEATALGACDLFLRKMPEYPAGRFSGRGIVICGGGLRYFTNAWVCINLLRHVGVTLPIQIWYLGVEELDDRMRQLVVPLGVECVDALEIRNQAPVRTLKGWELKPYAILNCRFREVMLLDADNMVAVNPEFLFDTPQYRATGVLFWPDFGRMGPNHLIWRLCGVEFRDEPEFETAQIVVDKERCWPAMKLTMWMNEHSDFFYRHIHGDKDTFHLAFRKVEHAYAMPERGVEWMSKVMRQFDFNGDLLFQHRSPSKWEFSGDNPPIEGFRFQEECDRFLAQLRECWDGRINQDPFVLPKSEDGRRAVSGLVEHRHEYHRVGYDRRPMSFKSNGCVGEGAARCETFWQIREEDGQLELLLSSHTDLTCRLMLSQNGVWKGRWLIYEKMPVELSLLEGTKMANPV